MDRILNESPMHYKRLQNDLEPLGEDHSKYSELLLELLDGYLISQGSELDEAISAYLKVCEDVMREELQYKKTGAYTTSLNFEQAANNVYHNSEVMRYYMLGMAMTQFLWRNHYLIFSFYRRMLTEKNISSHLEIGSGHGLFLLEALRHKPEATFSVVDISKTSLSLTSGLVSQ